MLEQPPTWFENVVSAMAYSSGHEHSALPDAKPPFNDVARFVLQQWGQMPDYLRAPLMALTLGFDVLAVPRYGALFHRCEPALRAQLLASARKSSLQAQRDLVRYFDSLGTFALYSKLEAEQDSNPRAEPTTVAKAQCARPGELRVQHLVIGSGPSGALTALLLAEAGCDVLLVEEGKHFPPDVPKPFSASEMLAKYRCGGQTVAFGADKISYVEARCVGGGAEINSGLYHRAPPEILEQWSKEFSVAQLDASSMQLHFEECERMLSVSAWPAPPASEKLRLGAHRMGWNSLEVPRWFKHDPSGAAIRQTTTRTFIPRFLAAGGCLLTSARASRLFQDRNGWNARFELPHGGEMRVQAEHVTLCCGAVQTPALLRRSGVSRNVGNSLAMHPTMKVVAEYDDEVTSSRSAVPSHQVKEFSPLLGFGCSITSRPFAALALMDHGITVTDALSRKLAIFYAMLSPSGRGSIRTVPFFKDPLVRYALTQQDRKNLGDGMRKLCTLLMESGAKRLYACIEGCRRIEGSRDVAGIPDMIQKGAANLMTIHLFASCPMGEDTRRCATDSFGRVHGLRSLRIHDASILCGPPGVNPQGTIMALARRNTLNLLGKL